jgi:hypothetical protein
MRFREGARGTYAMVLSTGDSRTPTTLSVGAGLSRATVRLATAVLQHQYGLAENAAFDMLRDVSQQHNVKLRLVAAGLVSPSAGMRSQPMRAGPPLPFTVGGRPCANRSEVLTELMRVAVSRSGTGRGTVQLCDQVHGGLQIEGKRGFGQDLADAFSHVSGHGTSCGHAFSDASQVVVADVDSSALFSESARETLLANEVLSCVSTPIVDDDGEVRGIVSTHQPRRDAIPNEADLRQLRGLANQCGRWLRWYDHMALPAVVAEVHNAAAAIANCNGSAGIANRVDPKATIADAARMLTTRYGVDPSHARAVLAAIAAKRGVSLHELAAQLTTKCNQPRS